MNTSFSCFIRVTLNVIISREHPCYPSYTKIIHVSYTRTNPITVNNRHKYKLMIQTWWQSTQIKLDTSNKSRQVCERLSANVTSKAGLNVQSNDKKSFTGNWNWKCNRVMTVSIGYPGIWIPGTALAKCQLISLCCRLIHSDLLYSFWCGN